MLPRPPTFSKQSERNHWVEENTVVEVERPGKHKNIHKSQFPAPQHEKGICAEKCPGGGQEFRKQVGKNSTSQFYVADRYGFVDILAFKCHNFHLFSLTLFASYLGDFFLLCIILLFCSITQSIRL